MNNKIISGFKTPDFKSILQNLKSAKKTKLTSQKKKKTSKTTEKKAKLKETEKKISSELKSIMKDVAKTVSSKNLETKDIKRKIVDLQAQSAVYNQDISMLLAAIGMLEARPAAFASMTKSMASGIEVMIEQGQHLDQTWKKTEHDLIVARQKEEELTRSIEAKLEVLQASEEDNHKLVNELGVAEDELLTAQTHEGEAKAQDLESEVLHQKQLVEEKEKRLEVLLTEKSKSAEGVTALKRKLMLLEEDSNRLDRLLKEEKVKTDMMQHDLTKNISLAAELKKQSIEWGDQNKQRWAEVDTLIESCKQRASFVANLQRDIDHFKENSLHYSNCITKTSGKIDSLRHQYKEKEETLKKLKEYANDLELMHARSLHEVKLMRRSLYR